MPPFPPWEDLPPELLCRVGDSLDIKFYSSARGACTAWRSALAPPSPSLLVVLHSDDVCPPSTTSLPTSRSFAACYCYPSAASLLARRSFELKTFPAGARCVGSSNGWLALSFRNNNYDGQGIFSLFNPVTATQVALPPLIYGTDGQLSKIVFTPNPTKNDFAAAAICAFDRLAYVTAGARRWAILGPVRLAARDGLADLVYHEKEGRVVYCLTVHGDIHVLRLPERRRRKPVKVNRQSSQGSHLNAPASVEPLLSLPTNFAWPYNKISEFTNAKNLVFCAGNMYQVWRNMTCTRTLKLLGGGQRRVEEDDIFVLRYYPRRQQCWVSVTDLGGYSVFIGRNNAVSMYAEAVPEIKGNCVYWIGGKDRDKGMVFDMATRRSTACLPAADGGAPQNTVCWYFLSDTVNNCNSIRGGKEVYQTRSKSLG